MKVKRLVSVLLAALLLVSMIPMNAMAALTWSDATQKDRVEVKMMISTTAPETPSYQSVTPGENEPVLKANADLANAAWSWDESGAVEAEAGDLIYIGFKVNVVDPDQYPLIASYLIGLKYNPDILTPVYNDGSEMTGEDYSDTDFKESIITNGVSSGAANIGLRVNPTAFSDAQRKEWILKYRGGLMIDAATGVRRSGDNYIGEMPLSMNTSNNQLYTANTPYATWDFVVPMMVKDGATGTATLEMVSPLGATSSEVVISGANMNGNTALSTKQIALNGANVARIQSNDVSVEVVKKSDPPAAEEADYTGSITNNTNKPYLTVTDANAAANNGHGPNDYITFPEEETGFKIGDQIYVYADENGSKLLGVTTLKSENFYKGAGEMYAENELTDADTVGGKTLRLAPETEEGTAKNGYGYIKNQQKVWIGRLNPDTENPNGLTIAVDKSNLIGINVNPETSLSYDGNVDAVSETDTGSALGSQANPIKVKLGDQIKDAWSQVDRLSFASNVTAPAEGDNEVETTVNWRTSFVAGNTSGTHKLLTDKFNMHGATTIVSPFKNATDEDGTAFHQPTSMVNDAGTAVTPVPVYGSQVYVEVTPNPADYLASTTGDGTGTFTVTGDSKAAWEAEFDPVYDYIEIYNEETGGNRIGGRYFLDGDTHQFGTLEVPNINNSNQKPMPAAGNMVYVYVHREGKPTLPRFAVPVAEAGYRVSGDVTITGSGLNNEVQIAAASKVIEIFDEVDPVFTISDENGSKQLHLMELLKTEMEGGKYPPAFDRNNLTIESTADPEGGKKWATATAYDNDNTKGGDPEERVTFTYKIEGGEYFAPLAADAPALAEEGDAPAGYEKVEFSNPQEFTVSFKAQYITRLLLSDGGDNSTITTTILQNDPVGTRIDDLENWDTFIVQGDVQHYNDKDNTPHAPSTIQVGDSVSVFDKKDLTTYPSIPITTGKVYEIKDNVTDNADGYDGTAGTTTYFIKVEQLGRTIDLTQQELVFKVSRTTAGEEDILPTREIPFTEQTDVPQEVYSLVRVVPYSPNTFTLDNSDTSCESAADVYAAVAPKTVTLEYAYMKEAGEDSHGFVIDDATKAQVTVNLPSDAEWTTERLINNVDIDFDGTNKSTYTMSLKGEDGGDLTATVDGKQIKIRTDPNKETEDLEIYIDVVSQAYNGPAINDIAAAIKAENNRYPDKDKVALDNLNVAFDDGAEADAKLDVYVYATQTDAEANTNAIATFEKLAAGAQSANQDLENALATEGGTLYVRAKASKTTLSDTATVEYDGEAYTFWGVAVDGDDEVKLNRQQIKYTSYTDENNKEDRDPEDQVTFITNSLTNTFKITAVRFTTVGGEVVVDEASKKTVSISLNDKWVKQSNQSNKEKITTADLPIILGSSGQTPAYMVEATINENDLSGASVSKIVGEAPDQTVVSYGVELKEPTDAPKREANGISETVTSKIYVSEDAPKKFEVPEDFDKYVTVSRGENELDFTDDSVVFFFADGDPAVAVTEPDMTGADFEFKIGDPDGGEDITITGTIENNAGIPTATVDKTTNASFKGIPADTTAIQVTFTKDGKKSDPITVSVDALSGAIEITGVKAPITLELTTGTILKDSDLTDLVTGGDDWSEAIESITVVTAKGDKTAGLKKATVGEGSSAPNAAQPVVWRLWVGDTSAEPVWADAVGTGIAEKLQTVEADKAYFLVAQFDDDSLKTEKLDNKNNLLAKIPVSLYDSHDDSFPLQLTEGNSDLYHNLKEDADEKIVEADLNFTQAELDARSAADGVTYQPEDFATDVILYYHAESYAEHLESYVTSGLAALAGEDDFTAWLADNADNVKVEQRHANGEKISQQKYDEDGAEDGAPVDYIEPNFSEDTDKYFESQTSYTRGQEDYVIRYKVLYEGKLYVIARKVRLTYQPGDVNMDTLVTPADAGLINDMIRDDFKLFVSEDENDEMADLLNKKVCDVYKDDTISPADANRIKDDVRDDTKISQRW